MDARTYEKIYAVLETSNVSSVSRDFCVEEGVLLSILNQKMLRTNKALYHRVAKDADALLERWADGESFVSLSRETGLSPVLISAILLKRTGMTRKEIQKMLKNPDKAEDRRLRKELSGVVEEDVLFTPRAHSLQLKRAKECEEAIGTWLSGKGIEFLTEEKIKKYGKKTPDFLLKSRLKIDDVDISWIESKALFGDEQEHRRLLKKQFLEYAEIFGPGMVVYWYGFVDSIAGWSDVLIKDSAYFGGDNARDIQ